MTESNPDTNPDTPDPTPPPAPDPAPKAEDTGRYAVYDRDHQRFVGPVHDTKAKASKAAKALDHRTEIREV